MAARAVQPAASKALKAAAAASVSGTRGRQVPGRGAVEDRLCRRRQPARRTSAPPPRKKKSGSGSRLFVGLLVVLALVAAGIVGYTALESSSSKSVQLREDVRGNVDSAIEELRGLIEDNTQ